jgi:hypothetical protein
MNGLEKKKSSSGLTIGPQTKSLFLAMQTMNFHFPDDAFLCLLNGVVPFEMFRKCIIWMMANTRMMRWQAEHWSDARPGNTRLD